MHLDALTEDYIMMKQNISNFVNISMSLISKPYIQISHTDLHCPFLYLFNILLNSTELKHQINLFVVVQCYGYL